MSVTRRSRLVLLLGLLVLSALLIGVGVLVGAGLRSPEELAALATPPPPSPVFVEVEEQTLVDTAVLRASVAEVEAEGIDLPLGGGTIVTSIDLDVGQLIQPGELLVTVEGRPRIALEGEFPFYRDLARRDEGPDVAQLEANLVALGLLDEADDAFGRDTQRALAGLYDAVGYEPPGGTWWRAGVDMNELVVFPDLPVRVSSLTFGVGDDLARAPSPHLTTSPRELVLVSDVDDPKTVGALAPGTRLTAIDDVRGARFDVEVVRASPGSNGTRVVFAIEGEMADLDPERSVRIDVPIATTAGPVTVVPVTALFTRPDGSVAVSTPAGDVEVRVGLIVDGWAEVEGVDRALHPGDLVTVSENHGG